MGTDIAKETTENVTISREGSVQLRVDRKAMRIIE